MQAADQTQIVQWVKNVGLIAGRFVAIPVKRSDESSCEPVNKNSFRLTF